MRVLGRIADRERARPGLAWPSCPSHRFHASEPSALSFAPDVHVRAFVLERAAGDLLVYDAPGAQAGTAVAQYLNHWHEPMVGGGKTGLPIAVHEADRAETETSPRWTGRSRRARRSTATSS